VAKQDLTPEAFDEERRMRYVSSFERNAQKKGIEKGMEKGVEKGIGKGQARLLHLQIQQRFGAPPPEVETRLQGATPEQLERWALRVLEAGSLDEVFRPDGEH
jgi:hypothetical protein